MSPHENKLDKLPRKSHNSSNRLGQPELGTEPQEKKRPRPGVGLAEPPTPLSGVNKRLKDTAVGYLTETIVHACT